MDMVTANHWVGRVLCSLSLQGKESRTDDLIRRAVTIGKTLYTFTNRTICSTRLEDFQIMDALLLTGYNESVHAMTYFDDGMLCATETRD